jgi:hypothetical protein
MPNMKNFIVKIAFTFLVAFTVIPNAEAQCPMCKMGAESNLKNGGTAGSGLNTGILYMLSMPYLLVGAIGFVWYKNRRKDSEMPGA